MILFIAVFFFFSSRRRHTRWTGDWSSDVCSSDLIVTTDIVSGDSVVLSEGSAAEAIIASTAIPGAFAPIRYKDFYLADGAISSNTPIRVAVAKGAKRLIVLPTCYACATHAPPVGAGA